jgi:hypothetical protein
VQRGTDARLAADRGRAERDERRRLGFAGVGGTDTACGKSFSVAVLSAIVAAARSSTRLVTVAVASCSPARPTVPQIVTLLSTPGAIQATSQMRFGAVLPRHPGPRPEYIIVTL